MAPDLCYIFKISEIYSHSFLTSFFITIPITVLFSLWIKNFFGPILKTHISQLFFVDLNSMMNYRKTAKVMIFISAGIGISTHLVWDGFTHQGWWLSRILFAQLPEQTPFSLWVVSSAVGTLYVWRTAFLKWPGEFLKIVSPKKFMLSGLLFFAAVLLWFFLFEKKIGGGSLSRSVSIPLILFPAAEMYVSRFIFHLKK